MSRERNKKMSEEKRNIIGQLIETYNIKTAADVQEALKDLLGRTIQDMLETELDQQMESTGRSGTGVCGQPKRIQAEDPAFEHGRNQDSGAARPEQRL